MVVVPLEPPVVLDAADISPILAAMLVPGCSWKPNTSARPTAKSVFSTWSWTEVLTLVGFAVVV